MERYEPQMPDTFRTASLIAIGLADTGYVTARELGLQEPAEVANELLELERCGWLVKYDAAADNVMLDEDRFDEEHVDAEFCDAGRPCGCWSQRDHLRHLVNAHGGSYRRRAMRESLAHLLRRNAADIYALSAVAGAAA